MKLPLCFCLLSAWCLSLPAQTKIAYPRSEQSGTNLPAQKLGPNDLIAISVYDAPELSKVVRVGADGFARIPMLARPVRADGLLPFELEQRLANELTASKLILEPVVSITVVEYHSRPISVVGAVRKPITFQSVGGTSLIDAITKAEGLMPDAGPEILVSTSQVDETGKAATLTRRVSIKSLIDEADPKMNLRLSGGEEIRVPEAGKVFLVGNVRRPGAFPVQESAGTSVLKLLALAEGLLPFTAKQGFVYRKEAGIAEKHEIPIEISKIVERKSPDVPLQAGDILYIPDNKGRRLALSTIDRIVGFGSSTGSGMLIWRR